jgi:hypothetical protein
LPLIFLDQQATATGSNHPSRLLRPSFADITVPCDISDLFRKTFLNRATFLCSSRHFQFVRLQDIFNLSDFKTFSICLNSRHFRFVRHQDVSESVQFDFSSFSSTTENSVATIRRESGLDFAPDYFE